MEIPGNPLASPNSFEIVLHKNSIPRPDNSIHQKPSKALATMDTLAIVKMGRLMTKAIDTLTCAGESPARKGFWAPAPDKGLQGREGDRQTISGRQTGEREGGKKEEMKRKGEGE